MFFHDDDDELWCVVSFHILGNAGQCLGHEFYSWPSLGQVLVESIFRNIEHLPDYRLKPVIRILCLLYTSPSPRDGV